MSAFSLVRGAQHVGVATAAVIRWAIESVRILMYGASYACSVADLWDASAW